MANTFLQVRVDEKDKERASAILDDLGTNLSAVVNMLIKQIIITESIPFEIRKKPDSIPFSHAAAYMDKSYETTDCRDSREWKDPVLEGIREEYEWGAK